MSSNDAHTYCVYSIWAIQIRSLLACENEKNERNWYKRETIIFAKLIATCASSAANKHFDKIAENRNICCWFCYASFWEIEFVERTIGKRGEKRRDELSRSHIVSHFSSVFPFIEIKIFVHFPYKYSFMHLSSRLLSYFWTYNLHLIVIAFVVVFWLTEAAIFLYLSSPLTYISLFYLYNTRDRKSSNRIS